MLLKRAAVLLLALCQAAALAAAELRAEPKAVAQAIELHADNLRLLATLPALPQSVIDTRPERSLSALSPSAVQETYLKEAAASPKPEDAAAGLILGAVARHPSLLDRVGPALEKALPDDPGAAQAASTTLWRWAAQNRTARAPEKGDPERAWGEIAKIFDNQTVETKAEEPRDAANDENFGARKGELSIEHHQVKPPRSQIDGWLGRGSDDPVAVAFGGMDPVLASELLELIRAPLEYHASAAAWLRTGNEDAKKRLAERPELLQAFYRIRREHEGALYEKHGSLPALLTAYRGEGAAGERLQSILAHTVAKADGYAVEQNPRTWNVLTEEQRDAAVSRMPAEAFGARRAAKLYLELRPETDLAALARRYALGREPRTLERYLSLRLRGGKGRARVPLENVMPTWIRKTFERFEDCTGANCINAALGVHENEGHKRRYVSGEEMLEVLGASFTKADPSKELQVGDLLVYTDAAKQFVHMAAYVGEGYVFNKAGASRYNPYVFQHKLAVEAAYYRPGGLRLLVFRRKP